MSDEANHNGSALPERGRQVDSPIPKKVCPRCGCDPTPIGRNPYSLTMAPCGLIPEGSGAYMIVGPVSINGCPMSDWQNGYMAALLSFQDNDV